MKKASLSLLLVLALLLGTFLTPASAADGIPLHQGSGPFNWENWLSGSQVITGANIPGSSLGTEGTVFWHFVNPDKLGGYAEITFRNGSGGSVTYTVSSYKNDQHFGVITPMDWQLLGAMYFPEKDPGKKGTQFNLSHTAARLGALKVRVDVSKEHEEVTWQDHLVRDVQDFYTQTRQDTYTQVVYDIYNQPNWDIYQRELQDTYVPTFEKKVTQTQKTTLVSRGGTAWGNGHTYLSLPIGTRQSVGIALSDPSNTPVGYSYFISVSETAVTLTLDDRLISASVALKVFAEEPAQTGPGSHTQLGPDRRSVSVPLPEGHGDIIYVYVHFEGGISFYTTGEYEFAGWKFKETREVRNYFVKNQQGELEFVKTFKGALVKVGDTALGPLVLVRHFEGEYTLEKRVKVKSETVQDPYDALFDVLVTDGGGNTVFSGQLGNHEEKLLDRLVPGSYTVQVSGADIGTRSKTVEVTAGSTASAIFDGIVLTGPTKDSDLPPERRDNKLPDDITPIQLDDIIIPDKREDEINPVKLPDVQLPDQQLEDIYLGNETDPFGEHAVRLN